MKILISLWNKKMMNTNLHLRLSLLDVYVKKNVCLLFCLLAIVQFYTIGSKSPKCFTKIPLIRGQLYVIWLPEKNYTLTNQITAVLAIGQ